MSTTQLSARSLADGDSVPEQEPPRLQDDDEEDHGVVHEDEDDDDMEKSKKESEGLPAKMVRAVVPKMEVLPWYTFLWLSILVAVPSFVYILCFTRLGKGLEWFHYLDHHYGHNFIPVVSGVSVAYFLIMYMMDVDSWVNYPWVQRFAGLLLVIGLIGTVILMVGDYPYLPICLFAALTPLWLISCNQICRAASTRVYVGWLSGPLFFVSMIVAALWITWVFMDEANEYNDVTKVAFAQATGCQANLDDFPECANDFAPITAPVSTTAAIVNRLLYDLSNRTYYQGDDQLSPPPSPSVLTTSPTPGESILSPEDIDALSPTIGEAFLVPEDSDVCFAVRVHSPAFIFPTDQECPSYCPTSVYKDCANGFILWAGPMLVSLVLFFLSFFCTFLRSDSAEKDMLNFGKLWLSLLFIVWLTASLSGVAAGLSSALVAMTLASFVGSAIFVAMTRSRSEGKQQAIEVWGRVNENYSDYESYMDVARGLFLVVCAPLIAIYLVLSVINQAVRKLGLPFSKKLKTPEAKADYLTKRTRQQVRTVQSWDRTRVLSFAVCWGIFFMVMIVIIAQFTVLFFSYLIEVTSTMNVASVTAILCSVGMIMFLLPPVPGVPIYLTLGIVIIAVGREMFGIIGSMAYASSVSLVLKLFACAVQQKGIGENLATYVSVRKMVGINSTLIKAMRLILAKPGMGLDKVCILVGGPDWPTSVLCGIMGLDLIPVLVGTLPVFALVLPTVLTGSFTYMAGSTLESGALEFPAAGALGTVCTAATAVVQFAAMVLAAYYLEQTTSQRADEIAAIEDDEEVAKLEAEEEHFNKCYAKVTQWEVVPTLYKLTLYAAFLGMVICCYMVQVFADRCFADYQLTYTIDEHLDGKWYTLLTPFGWYAVVVFGVACSLMGCFVSWANGEAKREAERNPKTDELEEQAPAATDADCA